MTKLGLHVVFICLHKFEAQHYCVNRFISFSAAYNPSNVQNNISCSVYLYIW